MSKYLLTTFAADETVTGTKDYSRKVDAEKAGIKSGYAWSVTSPKGVLVSEGKATGTPAEAAPADDAPKSEALKGFPKPADKAAPAPANKAAAPAKDKAAKPAKEKAAPKQRAVKYGTFEVKGDTHKCVGACGEKKAIKAFPTITGRPDVRVAECRTCRDTRTKAEKAARDAAK